MTTFGKIRAVANALNIPSYPDIFPGREEERPERWITYNYLVVNGALNGDDAPEEAIDTVQVHYFCSATENFVATMKSISKALLDADFTYPRLVSAGTEDSNRLRHVVLESDIESEV